MTYRFLPEYANHKRKQIKAYEPDPVTAAMKNERLDTILVATRRGLLTLDEAMIEIAKL